MTLYIPQQTVYHALLQTFVDNPHVGLPLKTTADNDMD